MHTIVMHIVKQVDCLRDACKSVRESKELLALFQALPLPLPTPHPRTRTSLHTPLRALLGAPPHTNPTQHTLNPRAGTSLHTPLRALSQVVLSVGNALNAGTGKGNAVGFKLSALLKLLYYLLLTTYYSLLTT